MYSKLVPLLDHNSWVFRTLVCSWVCEGGR